MNLSKTLLVIGFAALVALTAGAAYAETHRVPGQP
jgi:hypothetical protein